MSTQSDDPQTLTGHEMTDALVPLALELADAVHECDPGAIAAIRQAAEDVLRDHDRKPGAAGWALAVVAAAMLPGSGVPARVLLAPLQLRLRDNPRTALNYAVAAAGVTRL